MTTWCDGPLLGFDLETTGIDPFTDLPVSYGLVRMDRGEAVTIVSGLVDPGCVIPDAATAVHGITTERARAEGVALADAIATIGSHLLTASAEGVPVVGMNVRFDLTIVDVCMRRAGTPHLAATGWRGPVIDLLVIDRFVDPWREGSRKLVDLCAHYGVELSDAHECVADVEATLECVLVLARRFGDLASMELEALDCAQVAWYRDWAESFNHFREGRGHALPATDDYRWPLATGGASGTS